MKPEVALKRGSTFVRVAEGAKVIREAAQTAHDLWRQDDIEDAIAAARQIVEDAETVLRDAKAMLAGLESCR